MAFNSEQNPKIKNVKQTKYEELTTKNKKNRHSIQQQTKTTELQALEFGQTHTECDGLNMFVTLKMSF